MAGLFDAKYFNPEVFKSYLETVPSLKQNALAKAGIFRDRSDLTAALSEQGGGNYIEETMTGRIGGEALNYDGNTDIVADELGTYVQGKIVIGRAKAWQEKDFNFDITHHDHMVDVAAQTVEYWDGVHQGLLLSILKGIFQMNVGTFADKHTYDISAKDNALVGAETLNNAIQQAVGANKNIFTAAIMHSAVATNLENLQLLQYFKENDANGMQREIGLASWNGRTVLIDDELPVEGDTYTTYILGQGAFERAMVGAKVPNEVYRQPTTKGGIDMLIQRERVMYAPYGISFIQPSARIISPTNAELETAARWSLAKDHSGTGFIDHRAIPIVRIISKG